MYRLTTRTRAGTITGIAVVLLLAVGLAVPVFGSRTLIRISSSS